MIKRGLLSIPVFQYLSSQSNEISNFPQVKTRLGETVEKIFDTLEVILDSKKITQEEKDEMFNPSKISFFINKLTQHDPENTNAQEINKQKIILDLIQKVFSYYSSRYKSHKIIIKEINKFKTLSEDLKEIAEDEKSEDEASIMYRSRRKMPNPPIVMPIHDNWTALCIWCHAFSAIGNNYSEAVKHVRHTKNCSFHKEWKRFGKKDKERVIQQFFKLIPPLKRTKNP